MSLIAGLAAALYAVAPIHLQKGEALALSSTQAQLHAEPEPYRRPTTLAINGAGTVAVSTTSEIVVQRPRSIRCGAAISIADCLANRIRCVPRDAITAKDGHNSKRSPR